MNQRAVGTMLGTGLALFLVGCRYETVWSGAEYDSSGKQLLVAADEPFCGCLRLKNVSRQPVMITSRLSGLFQRGSLVLQPNQESNEKFDWAGPRGGDRYILEAFTTDTVPKPLLIRDVVRRVDIGWPFRPCDLIKCNFDPLFMNAGMLQQQ
jgi:hypothetical protein